MSKKVKIIISCIVGICIIIAIGVTIGAIKYNKFELVSDHVTSELGQELDEDVASYVVTGNRKIEEKTELDFSDVDIHKVGEYTARATYKKKVVTFTITIEDTTQPEIVMKETADSPIVGKEYAVRNFLDATTDLGGIKRISIEKSEKELVSGTDISAMQIILDEPGENSLTIICEDNSGNIAKDTITLKVRKDYESMVTGFQDWTIEAGSETDFMAGIETTDEITSVTTNADAIDINVPGEYTLTYTILGDDGETSITHDVHVIINEKKVEEKKNDTSKNTSQSNNNTQHIETNSVGEAYYNAAEAQEVLNIVNQRRAENGLSPLTMDSRACEAAKVRAAEIVTSFSHTRPDGRTCFTALDEAGLTNIAAGENIAAGQPNSSSVMNAWMNSEGHKANILMSGYTGIGVACYVCPGTSYGIYWVQVFISLP